MESFTQLLTNLGCPDNKVRSDAETELSNILLPQRVQLLTSFLKQPDATFEVQKMTALVLMRQETSSIDNDLLKLLEQNNQVQSFQTEILEIVQLNATTASLHKKLSDLLISVYLLCAPPDTDDASTTTVWPDCLQLLQGLDVHPVTLQAMIGYPSMFSSANEGKIVNLLARSFDSSDAKIRYLAARATCAFLVDQQPENIESIMGFGALMSNVMQTIVKSVTEDDDDSVIKNFIDVVECQTLAPLLKSGFGDIISLALQIVANDQVSDENKQLALEVIISLVETFPGLIRKMAASHKKMNQHDPITATMEACIAFIKQVDGGEDWLKVDEGDDTEYTSNCLSGESALDRLACALRGGAMLPRFVEMAPQMLNSADWQDRFAGMICIAAITEGCSLKMESMVNDFCRHVVGFLKDSHGRVRYAASYCIGHLANQLQETFTKTSHETVIPALIETFEYAEWPRLIGQSAASLVSFVEILPLSILINYIPDIMAKLEQILNREVGMERQHSLQQLITLIAAIAGQLEAAFIPYAPNLLTGLFDMVVACGNNPTHQKLKGKIIECYSIIALSVGKENVNAKPFMDILLGIQLTPEMWDEEDEVISYLISAWARMAKLMGKEFSGYMPEVMPPLLKACQIKTEVKVLNEGKEEKDEENWQYIRLPNDDSELGIKTSGLELKATACGMLVCYCREVGDTLEFKPYLEQVTELGISLTQFYFHEDCRVQGAEILEAITSHHPQAWQGANICNQFIKVMETEPDETVLPEVMDVFSKAITGLKDNPELIFQGEQLQKIIFLLNEKLKEHMDNSAERQAKQQNPDFDEGDGEELVEAQDSDEAVLQAMASILHAIFGTVGEQALPFYDTIHGHFCTLIEKNRIYSDRQWAFCVFDDIIEHCGQSSLKYADVFLPHLVSGLTDTMGEIRQATAYGIGILAKAVQKHGMQGSMYSEALTQAVEKLKSVIIQGIEFRKKDENEPDEGKHEFEIDPWENAISAFGKIMRYTPELCPMDQAFDPWFSWIADAEGLNSDAEEATATLEWLNALLLENHPQIMTPDKLKAFVNIVGCMITSCILDDEGPEEKEKSLGILKEMIKQDPASVQSMVDCCKPLVKRNLENALQK